MRLKTDSKGANAIGWNKPHNTALIFPTSTERPIIHLLQAWELYAIEYRRRHAPSLSEDLVLGTAWLEMGRALRILLKGDLERLHPGTLDKFIVETIREAGADPEAISS